MITRHEGTVTLSDSSDLFSLATQIDTLEVNGRVFVNSYDAGAREFAATTPEGRTSVGAVDSLGRVVKDSTAGLAAVGFAYDTQGRLSQLTQASRTWTYDYDAAGRLLSVVDPEARADSFFYDGADRLTRQVLPDGREVLYGYDGAGNLTSVTPPGRPAHDFTYTSVNLADTYAPPDLTGGPTPTGYSYNLDRQLTRITRPDSQTIDFAYDSAGRASAVTVPGGEIAYGYDPTTGTLSSVAGPYAAADSLTFGYDGSLLTDVTWSGEVAGTLTATYDDDFRVTQTTVNGGNAVSFGYNDDGLLEQAGSLAIARDAANGLITGTTLGSVATTRSYNPFGEWSEYAAEVSGSDVFGAVYTRDDLGRITQIVETVEGTTRVLDYAYDAAGRLEEVMTDSVVTASYTYDANGNRLQRTTPGGTETGTYDDQDRLLTYAGATYSYTLAGELAEKIEGADTTSYAYDVLGNLTQVTLPDGTEIEYVVDGLSRRIGKKVDGSLVHGFLYEDQLNPVAELDSLGQVASRLVYATRSHVPDYVVKGGTTYRIVSDHLGSVRLVIDESTGTVAQRLDYDEFGNVLTDTNPGFQPFGFAGGIYDADTGLTRFGARDYDPVVGRWAAKDPIGFDGGSTNLYAYVLADPVNFIDPVGLFVWDLIDIGFFADSFVRFISCPGWGRFGTLTLDALALLPGIPSAGYLRQLNRLADARGFKPLLGRNPGKLRGTRATTDLPGGRATARSIFNNQTKGQAIRTRTMDNGGTIRIADDGTAIRFNPDGTTRVDLPGRGPMGRETIHFKDNP